METENTQLNDALNYMQAENDHLKEEVNVLENALVKKKKFHLKFAYEVTVTEAARGEEKRTLVDENNLLVKQNRQLKKAVKFYKETHEELPKEDERAVNGQRCSKPIDCTHKALQSNRQLNEKLAIQRLGMIVISAHESRPCSPRSLQTECEKMRTVFDEKKALLEENQRLVVENQQLKLLVGPLVEATYNALMGVN